MGRAFCRLGVHGHEAPAKLLLLVICSIISPILFFFRPGILFNDNLRISVFIPAVIPDCVVYLVLRFLCKLSGCFLFG
jgi:hypothetical protein